MVYEFLGQLKYWTNLVVSPISVLLNIVLFYLIKNKSDKALSKYKKVLFLGCVSDLCFGTLNLLIAPVSFYFCFLRKKRKLQKCPNLNGKIQKKIFIN